MDSCEVDWTTPALNMENGITEEKTEDTLEEDEEHVGEVNLEIAQLQGLVAELREGLHAALMELGELRQRDQSLEEKLQAHQTDVDDKIMSLKNSLNTFKEELNIALFHIKEASSRQREVQKRLETLQSEHTKDIISSTSDNEAQQQFVGEGKNTRDDTENPSSPSEKTVKHFSCSVRADKRQRAALELLESERLYVSHLSLLLKANISFNGSEAIAPKDKRPFPSSLRFLIQQHLELLHTLQERVLRCQWQGIMGDVFMRLTSKESDFLDFYVSYLKELPDCLSVITMLASSSTKSSALLESDIMGDESKPSLHTLLLQPVQRIPDYMLLLQGLLKQTDADHPDYYLLLVSMQQFRAFTAQYHHLLQHNQELLLHHRKEVKSASMKQLLKTVESGIQANNIGSPYPCSSAMMERSNKAKLSKQHLLEQIQSQRYQDRERAPESHCYETEWPSQLPYFSPDLDSRNHKAAGLGSIPESEAPETPLSCQHHLPSRPSEFRQVQPGSALADALGEFLLPPDPPEMESLYDEDGGSFHDASMFDCCSSASSDSSIDIAFVKCPKPPLASHHAIAANVSPTRVVYGSSRNQGNGYRKLPNRGCVSPDEAIMMRHNQHRPLKASQRKSKSLNGLQMDTVSSLDGGPLSDPLQRAGQGSHAKLERQGSKGSKGGSSTSHKVHSPLGNRLDTDKQSPDLHGLLSIDSGIQSWADESKWRSGTDESNHTPFSEKSRKQDKGGFRSSFKKLFKKKNSDEKKEKGEEKAPENQNNVEHETAGKNGKLVHVEINRGTAV
ncbi:rho guanine nucleotide exchange factor 33 [Echeneis naucrates]|uniref:rho guanine nucleotide exchange factor 33 n=1 Tax=Echeneis naucrates TaxID=173247 RepID=UPI0011137426|nr:rho guanine nucleotide exchange factor 33 [Echeneis naucrates]